MNASILAATIVINDRNYTGLLINRVPVYYRIAWGSLRRKEAALLFEEKSKGGYDLPAAASLLAAAQADGIREIE